MITIKLDAIDSTNDFLKNLSKNSEVDNFTMVVANSQTNGKGQRGLTWSSEAGKNVIMSILLKNELVSNEQIVDLNLVTSLAVYHVLEAQNIPNLSIKWPNDIMSETKKIGGILIENIFKTDNCIVSIIGIGLNVNQTDFSLLPKASSLATISGLTYNIDFLTQEIRKKLIQNVKNLLNQPSFLWKHYQEKLFKIGVPMAFENNKNHRFMAIIKGVSSKGRLQLLLDDDTIVEFDIKEIKMLY